MRAAAAPGLSSTSVALGPLRLGPSWSDVDLGDVEVLETLRAYVGTHIQLHPDDVGELESVGLEFADGRIIDGPVAAVVDDESTDTSTKRRKK